jgi:hypothetical protein
VTLTETQKRLALAGVILVALTWWAGTSVDSPFRPGPARPDRPVLRFVGKITAIAARLGLTALFFCETPTDPDEVSISHAAIGSDGHPMLRNEVW